MLANYPTTLFTTFEAAEACANRARQDCLDDWLYRVVSRDGNWAILVQDDHGKKLGYL